MSKRDVLVTGVILLCLSVTGYAYGLAHEQRVSAEAYKQELRDQIEIEVLEQRLHKLRVKGGEQCVEHCLMEAQVRDDERVSWGGDANLRWPGGTKATSREARAYHLGYEQMNERLAKPFSGGW